MASRCGATHLSLSPSCLDAALPGRRLSLLCATSTETRLHRLGTATMLKIQYEPPPSSAGQLAGCAILGYVAIILLRISLRNAQATLTKHLPNRATQLGHVARDSYHGQGFQVYSRGRPVALSACHRLYTRNSGLIFIQTACLNIEAHVDPTTSMLIAIPPYHQSELHTIVTNYSISLNFDVLTASSHRLGIALISAQCLPVPGCSEARHAVLL